VTLDFKKLVFSPFNFVSTPEVLMRPAPAPADDFIDLTLLSEREKSAL
jgi:hypothetical protein